MKPDLRCRGVLDGLRPSGRACRYASVERRMRIRALPSLLLVAALAAQGRQAPWAMRQGRVVDTLGEGVPVAAVAVHCRGAVVARAVADAQGIYLVKWKAQPGCELHFTAAGKAEVREAAGSGTAVGNVVLEDGCRVHGSVTDADGAPIAGASVLVLAGLWSAETTTGLGGNFVFPAVPLRAATVRVFTKAACLDQRLQLRDDARCDFRVAPGPGGMRVVRVRGLPADAAATAFVEMTSHDLVLQPGRGRVPLRADGTAVVMPTETSLVRIVAPGFTSRPLGLLIDPGCDATLEFALARDALPAPATVMAGRVLDGSDRPVAGARLIAVDRSYAEAAAAVADADGRFVLAVRLPRSTFCRLGLELADHYLEVDPVRIARGHSWIDTTADPTANRVLRVARAGGLRTEVRGPTGEGFAFADVAVATLERPFAPVLVAATDQQGTLVVRGLPPGSYQLTATSHEGEIAGAKVEIVAGAVGTIARWRHVPSGWLEGRVIDGNGQPVPGLEVHLASPYLMEGDVEFAEGLLDRTVVTDRHGRFRCRGLPPGEWGVSAPREPRVTSGFFDVVAGIGSHVQLVLER